MYIKHNYSKGRGWSAIPHVSDYFCPLCLASLALEMVKFSSTLVTWLRVALKGLPESLQSAKYKCKTCEYICLSRGDVICNVNNLHIDVHCNA